MSAPRFFRLLFVLLASVLFSSMALAGTVPLPSDVSVTLTATPTSNLAPGDSIVFTMTVTNNGPSSLSAFSIVGPQISTQFYYPTTSWNDCNLITITGDSTNGPFWIPEWNPTGPIGEDPMAVGEIRVCHFTLTVAPTFPPGYPFTIRLGTLWTDPNSSNNSATVLLQRAIDPIPALSSTMLLILAGLLAVIASIVSRRVY
jgi:hypothetical protein